MLVKIAIYLYKTGHQWLPSIHAKWHFYSMFVIKCALRNNVHPIIFCKIFVEFNRKMQWEFGLESSELNNWQFDVCVFCVCMNEYEINTVRKSCSGLRKMILLCGSVKTTYLRWIFIETAAAATKLQPTIIQTEWNQLVDKMNNSSLVGCRANFH